MLGLVCIDVDGTLVGSAGEVLPQVWAAAARARAAGVRLALCSGRPAFGKARAYAERLDAQGWHIFQNGASVVNVGSGESRSEALAPLALGRLVERARSRGRILETYSDSAYAVESARRAARAHAQLLGVDFAPSDLLALPGPVVRAQWVAEGAEAQQILAEPHPELTLSPAGSPVMPQATFISLTRAGVDKASAVRRVAQLYGVPLEQTMMVGDGRNDAAALRTVGHGVAMGNAEPEARAAATTVVADVDEGGLIEALELALTR